VGWAQAGGRAHGTPSIISSCQVPSVTSMWWRGQAKTRLSMSVGPASAQAVTWWTSHRYPGDGAAGDDAADVAGVQGGLLGGGGEAVAAAQVQHGAVLVQDDPADAGVARQ
jgi:hypothetical protein